MMKIMEFSTVDSSNMVLNVEQTENAVVRLKLRVEKTMQLTLRTKARTLKGSMENRTQNEPPPSP